MNEKIKQMQQVEQIMRLGLLVNGATDNDVFIRYSGHIDALRVTVYKAGWKEGAENKEFEVYLDMENSNMALSSVKEYLADLYMAEVQNVMSAASIIAIADEK